ncbi:hypothetical protein RvY_10433 [Ramazzottius varieornatus]|uniref:Uncharacterized protein n=1 Tax=Ramazzottius varieornatus TaxID=947166 RepID=A0A1D1VI34_RAMVA|nr:hypothetical protein RvY_10433 [Ramazzottius varieornatus]
MLGDISSEHLSAKAACLFIRLTIGHFLPNQTKPNSNHVPPIPAEASRWTEEDCVRTSVYEDFCWKNGFKAGHDSVGHKHQVCRPSFYFYDHKPHEATDVPGQIA